ncbi:MAG: hypothetical protein ACD_12C00692G0001 [uncultured bacterium]|nr:MAG: hypothetical protein ACD_12C00692G0001 [uncultured bacterium]
MQYPYFILLEIVTVFLTLFIGIIIFYSLIKRWQKIKFSTVFKAIFLYESGSLLFYLIYPFSQLSRIFNNNIFKILNLLLFSIILFFIFYFIMRKIISITWKKSLIAFLLMILIIFPFLNSFRKIFVWKIYNLPIFTKEKLEMEKQVKEYFFSFFYLNEFSIPVSFKIVGKIGSGTIGCPGDYLEWTIKQIQISNKSSEEESDYFVKVISPKKIKTIIL